MSASPEDRYADAGALRADIRAYLEGELLAAADYSSLQRLQKWVSRNRQRVALVASVVAVALVLIGGSRWMRASDIAAHIDAASVAADAGKIDEALTAYGRALTLDPAHDVALDGRRQLLLDHVQREQKVLKSPAALSKQWRRRDARRARGESDQVTTLAQREAHQRVVSVALALTALLDRGLESDPSSTEIRTLRQTVGEALGWLALLGGDHTLADHAFGTLRHHGLGDRKLKQLTDAVRTDRTRKLALWLLRTDEALKDIGDGLNRPGRPAGANLLQDYVIEVARYRHPDVVAALSRALETRIISLVPERGTGRGQVYWSLAEKDIARFALRTLGRIALPQAIEPLSRVLKEVDERTIQLEAGLALCNTRMKEAHRPLAEARRRWGEASSRWNVIRRRMARLPLVVSSNPLSEGMVRARRGEFEKALELFDAAISAAPSMDGYYWRGSAHLALKQYRRRSSI